MEFIELDIPAVFSALGAIPWFAVLIAGIISFLLAMLWYGKFFKGLMKRVMPESCTCEKNTTLMVLQFLTSLIIAYVVALFTVFASSPEGYWLMIDGLIGVVVFIMLMEALNRISITSDALKVWLVHFGFFVVQVFVAILVFAYIA